MLSVILEDTKCFEGLTQWKSPQTNHQVYMALSSS